MKGRTAAALDAACARANPALAPVAAIALLDIAVAAQQRATVHPVAPVPARTLVAGIPADGCTPVLAPELRDMAGRD